MSEGPLLSTERFGLWRPRGASDLEGQCRLIADEDTRRYLGTFVDGVQPQWERLMRNAGSWALYGYGGFYARPHGSDEIIGSLGVFHSWRGLDARMDDQPEAGWIVRRDHWGQGVAGEVMRVVLPWFDARHGPRRIVAMIEAGNVGSERVAGRFGFTRFDQIVEPDGTAVVLYERLPPV